MNRCSDSRPRMTTRIGRRSPRRGAPRRLLASRPQAWGPMLCERVTDAADCPDRVGAQLLTQMVDVNFDCVALDFLTPTIDPLFELAFGQRGAGTLQQCGE